MAGSPARPVVVSERLADLVHEAASVPEADIFARLTSFSHAVVGDRTTVQQRVRRVLPWLDPKDFPTEERQLRDFVAQAYNAALPTYDLVIIDEAHNLGGGVTVKNGVVGGGAIRNAVLAQVLGHPDVVPHPRFSRTYRPRADRVLMLSATPVEDSFRAMWNQLHLVGKVAPPSRESLDVMKEGGDEAAATAARVLVRRINTVRVNGTSHTKSQYRRTWHQGGVALHDQPLEPGSLRQRLSVALVQKKVSDLVGTKFNNQFQMGMLASFESFAETALKPPKPAEPSVAADDGEGRAEGTFDGDQTDDPVERLGIDTGAVNALARDHYDTFKTELAHPKMDALVADLAGCWDSGTKTLVFVRRVASVTEIKRKVDEAYDRWLFARLEAELPDRVWRLVLAAREVYAERRAAEGRHQVGPDDGAADTGGADTFFAWFFRGQGPDLGSIATNGAPIESGASLARRTGMASGAASTFFAEHHVADVFRCDPTVSLLRLADAVGRDVGSTVEELKRRARFFLPRSAGRRHTFDAIQVAALELLLDELPPTDDLRETVAALFSELQVKRGEERDLALDVEKQLKTSTFFSRMRRHPELTAALLPTALSAARDPEWAREHYLRTSMLAAATRLGNPLIDLYATFMRVSTSGSATDNDEMDRVVDAFLALLERQRLADVPAGAFRELHQIAIDFELVRHLNLPSTAREDFVLASASTECGTLLGKQQPAVGMAGRVQQTAVRQFRMPGYPYVLVCTDVLQEGEDLHTYCDRVVHYGVAWTASAMEQRTGRVDRINSLADRRFRVLDSARRSLEGADKIQVQLPYLAETVERVQARTVLRRMHAFSSLMHQGADADERRLDLATEILREDWEPAVPALPQVSAFDVKDSDLRGRARGSTASGDVLAAWWARLVEIVADGEMASDFTSPSMDRARLAVHGARPIGGRDQPISLHLVSRDSMPVVSARAPIARIANTAECRDALVDELTGKLDRVIVTEHAATHEYDVAIAGDVILGSPVLDGARVARLVRRITDVAHQLELAVTNGDLTGAEGVATEPVDQWTDWQELADGLGVVNVRNRSIRVNLGNGRRHTVIVVDRGAAWELSGQAASAGDLERAELRPLDLWRLNEQRTLTSHVVEGDGSVWITALVPAVDLTAEEFGYFARLVASEADRLEFRLTGDDNF